MDDWKRSLEPGWDHPPLLLTRHGLLPLHSVPTYAPVPAWEKGFVTDVCGIPWKRLLEAKKLMSVYQNIVHWDDSGARENFENEKARFWAGLNGLRCEIPLPAPDLYLDKVDYDAEIVADLEKPPPQPQLPAIASHGWDSFYLADRVPVTGWCDAEDPVQSNWETTDDKLIVPTGWGDEGYSAPHTGFVFSGFSAANRDANNGLNDADRNYSQGWEQKNSGDSLIYFTAWQEWRNRKNDSSVSLENKTNGRNFNSRKREECWYGNRWTRSGYPRDNYHVNHRGNNGREGSRMGFVHDNAMYDNQPLAMR